MRVERSVPRLTIQPPNGLVDRQLEAALKANPHPEHWTDALPLILLGIQTATKDDVFCTAAEFVYGTTLCLPGESSLLVISRCPAV